MHRYNFPGRRKQRREKALAYWKRQLSKATRSKKCEASDEFIKKQVTALEAKVKEAA